MKRWYCAPPWRVTGAEIDLRGGGAYRIAMAGSDGEVHVSKGVYLEVVRDRRIVFTDAFSEPWAPSEKPFMVCTVTFDEEGDRTRYTAIVDHWTAEDALSHRQRGFHDGWSAASGQLEELARTL